MTLERFLILGAVLFGIGLYGALSKKHAIAVLMSLETVSYTHLRAHET